MSNHEIVAALMGFGIGGVVVWSYVIGPLLDWLFDRMARDAR